MLAPSTRPAAPLRPLHRVRPPAPSARAARMALRRGLVDGNLALVRKLALRAWRTVGAYIELDDLVAWGTVGLCEAADRFDPRSGVRFATFAYRRVHGAIYDGLRHMGYVPRTQHQRLRAAERAEAYLANLTLREGGGGGPVEADKRALHEALRSLPAAFVVSLEAHQAARGEVASPAQPAEEAVAAAEIGHCLDEAVAALPERERHFIERHYYRSETLDQSARELGLSRSWASRLHTRALEQLREELRQRL